MRPAVVFLIMWPMPFIYAFGTGPVANLAGFALWLFWCVCLLCVLFLITTGRSTASRSRPPWLVRVVSRLILGLGIMTLTAFSHYLLALLILLVVFLVRVGDQCREEVTDGLG